MKFILGFVLIISVIEINGFTDDKFQLLSECDRTVGSGVATCMQYFSPIKFVTDFLGGNRESLCCTHFRHNACILGVRDAVELAKAANLCPDSISDELISTLTDSGINNYITKSCKTFSAGKCVMDSVKDVVNTIQGFFTPQQQQKPVINQLFNTVPQIFNRGVGNSYSSDDSYNRSPNYNRNHNYNTVRTPLLGPFREIINRGIVTTTENPLINKSVRDLFDRQYIPEASAVEPIKEVANENRSEVANPMRDLFSGFIDPTEEVDEDPEVNGENLSIIDSIGDIMSSIQRNNSNIGFNLSSIFDQIFNPNQTNNQTIS